MVANRFNGYNSQQRIALSNVTYSYYAESLVIIIWTMCRFPIIGKELWQLQSTGATSLTNTVIKEEG